jgi:predicted phosphodiesterase
MGLSTTLVCADNHFPAHSVGAHELFFGVGRDTEPDRIVLIGDVADLHCISTHGKDPRVTASLEDEIDAVRGFLDRLDYEFPKAQKVYIQGNHEYRWWRKWCSIYEKHPELGIMSDTYSWDEVVGIPNRHRWEFIPYSGQQLYRIPGSSLYARHEPLSGGKGHAKLTSERGGHSVLYGHTHTIQEAQTNTLSGEAIRAMSIGCMCDWTHPAFSYLKTPPAWGLGFYSILLDNANDKWYGSMHHVLKDGGRYTTRYGHELYEWEE